MKKMLLICAVVFGFVAHAEPTVTGVTAQQRYPWNGLVDIVVTLEGVTAEEVSEVECLFAATNSATGVAISVKSISQKGLDTGSGTSWNRRFIWDATKDVGMVKIDDVALTVDAKVTDCVQLWENGPYWAKCNVGATKPEEYGYYFWWGDTVGYKRNASYSGWISVQDGTSFLFSDSNCPTYGMNYSQLKSAGYTDWIGNLVAAHDAATAHLGAPWRMPTVSEIDALINNCDTTWMTRNGVWGRLVTGRGAYVSKSIFLPAAGYGYNSSLYDAGSSGYYWSSTPDSDYSNFAWSLGVNSSNFISQYCMRYCGQSVRPLRRFASEVMSDLQTGVGVTTHLKLDCRTGVRTTEKTETITYSIAWIEGAGEGAVAVVSVNGTALSEKTGSGTIEWDPSRGGTNVLTHIVKKNGAQVGETLSATFNVNGGPYTEIVDGVKWTYMAQDGWATLGSGNPKGSTAVPKSTVGAIVLPSRIGGCDVGAIADYAFHGCDKLTAVTICGGIARIGTAAFAGCIDLNAINFEGAPPEGVSDASIKQDAAIRYNGMYYAQWDPLVKQCGWTNAKPYAPYPFPEGGPYKETVDGIEWTFMVTNGEACVGTGSSSGTAIPAATTGEIAIPTELGGHAVTSIGQEAFYCCKAITGATIPSSITSIGKSAFGKCIKLEGVMIPASVTNIGICAFSGDCESLKWIDVEAESACYSAQDGVLFNKDKTALIQYPGAKAGTYTIPESVTHVGVWSFQWCHNLERLTVPTNVVSMAESAFFTGVYTFVIDFEGAPQEGIRDAFINSASPIRYNIAYRDEWGQVVEDCQWTNAKPYYPVLLPEGGPYKEKIEGIEWTFMVGADLNVSVGNGLYGGLAIPQSTTGAIVIPEILGGRTVTSIGNSAFAYCYSLTSVTIPSSVTSIGDHALCCCTGLTSMTIPSSVTSIGYGAFSRCAGLIDVTISDGVTSIGEHAFSSCSSLTSVTIPSSVTSIGASAFYDCSELRSIEVSVTNKNYSSYDGVLFDRGKTVLIRCPGGKQGTCAIPSGVTSIGEDAFVRCTGLMRVIIPEGVTSIGKYAFYDCGGLTSVTIPSSVKSIGGWAFQYCGGLVDVTICEGVTNIGAKAFSCCSSLTSVTIPSSVTSIDDFVFSGCAGLVDVTICEGVTNIGAQAFSCCSSLTSVTIPSSVTSIGVNAFAVCKGLIDVTICEGVTSIGYGAFSSCGLKSVTIPSSVTSIGERAFYGCGGLTNVTISGGAMSIGDEAFYGCSGLTSVTISEGVTSIGAGAFRGCSGLTSVTIPSSVTSIANAAFMGCTGLIDVTISEGVTSIGYGAFSSCGLTSVIIPSSVTDFGTRAFADCSRLTSAEISEGVTSIGEYAFYNCTGLRCVTIPDSVTQVAHGAFSGCTSSFVAYIPYQLTDVSAFPSTCHLIRRVRVLVIGKDVHYLYDGTAHEPCWDYSPNIDCAYVGTNACVRAGQYKIYATAEDFWYDTDKYLATLVVSGASSVTVNKRNATVTSDGAEKQYDGTEIVLPDVVIDGDGFVEGECDVEAVGRLVDVGCCTNDIVISWRSEDLESNYSIITNEGVFSITARPVSVSAQSAEKVYDGTPLTAGVEIGGMGFVDGECDVSGTGSQTTVGSSENGVQLNWMGAGVPTNYDMAITNGTLTIKPAKVSPDGKEPGEGEVPVGGISKHDTTTIYDGAGHTIDTNRLAAVKLVDPISLSYSMTSNGVYQPEPILFTNACVTSMWYKISAANYEDYIHEAKVTVLPRGVTLTSGSAEKPYDGTPLVCHEYAIGGGGFIEGEGVEITYAGSQTLVGTSENTFTHAFSEGTSADNYDVTTSNGTLTVIHAGKMEPPMIIEHEFVGESASIHFAPVGEGVTIRYTTDGSVPTLSSEVYDGGIEVTDTTRIRAFASAYGWIDSDVSDETVRCTAGVVDGDYPTVASRYPSSHATMTNVLVRGKENLTKAFFAGCVALRSVTLSDDLRSIDCDTFDALPSFEWEVVDGYKYCSNWLFGYTNDAVEELTHTDTLKGVANGALDGCKNIEAFTCKEASPLTYIGKAAFRGCKNLVRLSLPTGVQEIAAFAFANDYYLDNVVIPDSVEEIGVGAFSNCTEMVSISFGSGLKFVGDSAFENCISLEAVVFQPGLESLGSRAFYAFPSSRLKSVSLPASLKEIGDDAFVGGVRITGVTVPTHIKTLADVFPDSYQDIESVVVPDGEDRIMDAMFQGGSAITSIIIPISVTNIGESAFADCVSLVEQGLPDEVTTLGARAFSGCVALKTVSLPRKLKAICDETFSKCPMLDSLKVPAQVMSLGHNIYSGLEGTARLTGIYYLTTSNAPKVVYSDSYAGTPSELKSYVIKGSTDWFMPGSPTLPPDGWPTVGNARDITYWTPNEFEVTFDGNGGSPETYVSKQITDTTYSLPKSDPVRDGYLFKGWWTEKEAGAQIYWNTRVTATKAHTLYAHWKSMTEMITVVFHPNGGTVEPSEKKYPPGVTFGELPVPTRIGHNFVGWYTSQVGGDLVDESTPVTKENNELYAHWEPITYSVAFDANGGLGEMKLQTHTYNVPQALSSNAYYLVGFNFTGWSETRGGVVKYANKQVVENLEEVQGRVKTLYAVWAGAKYSVRFDANGGEGIMENQTHQVGVSQALTKCTFTRKGYSFLGWATTPKGVVEYEDEEEVQNLTMQASATVPLYAVWSPNPYSIAYDANGGTGTMSPTACLYDKEATIAACGFTKDGYSFTGWATSAEGEVVYTPGQKVLNLTDEAGKVITLFAVWELGGVEVPVFSPKDGTVFKGSCTVTLTCTTPGASIYYRIGAKPKASSKYLYSEPFEITETSTVYAFAKLGDTESDCVSATYTKGKVITFEEAVKAKGITAFTHGGDAVWGVEEGLGEGDVCVRSGVIIDEQVSWFETTVQGPGTISFKWKASCEEDYPSQEWDHLAFNIDGAKDDYARLDGVTDWEEVSAKLEAGTHTLRWSYVKDESDDEGEDCGWVDCVTWVADAPAPVPPGGEIDVPEGKTAKEFADEVNKNKAQYLKWPLEGPVSTDYLGYFTAVPKGDAKVEFVLNEEGTNQVVEATTAAKTNTLESVLSKTGTLVIGDPLIGFYYSLKQGSDVTVGDKADLNKLAGRDELSFPLTTDKPQYFYQSLVTPTPVPTK